MMQLSETVSDERGRFHALVMARERNDGTWEGWLEFVSTDKKSCRYITPVETRQHDRATMERWASGLTVVYADGALARARTPHTATAESQQQIALQELIEALDRRVPHVERAGEAKIADEARRLRAAASERIELLGARATAGVSVLERAARAVAEHRHGLELESIGHERAERRHTEEEDRQAAWEARHATIAATVPSPTRAADAARLSMLEKPGKQQPKSKRGDS